jgi:hypothetical protein
LKCALVAVDQEDVLKACGQGRVEFFALIEVGFGRDDVHPQHMFAGSELKARGLVHFNSAQKGAALIVPAQILIQDELVINPHGSFSRFKVMQNLDSKLGSLNRCRRFRCFFNGRDCVYTMLGDSHLLNEWSRGRRRRRGQ